MRRIPICLIALCCHASLALAQTNILDQSELEQLNVFPTNTSAVGYAMAMEDELRVSIEVMPVVAVYVTDIDAEYIVQSCDDLEAGEWDTVVSISPERRGTYRLFMSELSSHQYFRVQRVETSAVVPADKTVEIKREVTDVPPIPSS